MSIDTRELAPPRGGSALGFGLAMERALDVALGS